MMEATIRNVAVHNSEYCEQIDRIAVELRVGSDAQLGPRCDV